MGKKVTPKFSAYMYQWTHYAKDFERVRNLQRKGGNNQAGRRFALINSQLDGSDPKQHWLACGQFKGGQFKVYAICKLRAPSTQENCDHSAECASGERAFEKYVYIDEEKSFIVALPGEEGVFDHQLDNLFQIEIAKRKRQLQGSNGLEIQIDDFYIERLKRRQIMTVADRIRQLGSESVSADMPEDAEPDWSNAGLVGENVPNTAESVTSSVDVPTSGLSDMELAHDLDEFAKKIDDECANLEGQDVDAIVKRRVGQGIFRKLLLEQFGGACCMTGLTNLRLLIASHIVPWSKSEPAQKLAPENGLLLSVSMDALFDKGLISFSDNGSILIGNELRAEEIEILGLDREFALPEVLLTDGRLKNLAKHRGFHGFDSSFR